MRKINKMTSDRRSVSRLFENKAVACASAVGGVGTGMGESVKFGAAELKSARVIDQVRLFVYTLPR